MKQKMLKNEQVYTFCVALEHLIHAGIGLGDAFVLLSADEQEPILRQMLKEMGRQADAGASLAQVIRQAGCFPAYVCTLVEVGERVGKTEQTLEALGKYYEGRDRMDRRVRSALLYPAILMLVLLAVAVILLVWVLPVFNDVYAQLGSSLTGVAASLLNLGSMLRKGMPVLCLILAVVAVILAISPVRKGVASLWNRIAGDRGVQRKILSARFVQALSMAITSGMTVQEAVLLASALAQGETPAFGERCRKCLSAVERGETLSKALLQGDFLQAADRRLLDAGNRSGKSEDVLQQIAQRLSEQSEEELERRAGYVEPILVAVACLLIGAVLLSVMLPLMQIMTAIG